jgi:hypothetical protein
LQEKKTMAAHAIVYLRATTVCRTFLQASRHPQQTFTDFFVWISTHTRDKQLRLRALERKTKKHLEKLLHKQKKKTKKNKKKKTKSQK